MGIIYAIVGPDGKRYVGQCCRKQRSGREMSINQQLKNRWREHRAQTSGCVALRNAIRKYGKDAFHHEVLVQVPDADLNHYEVKFISMYDSENHRFGYNRTPGGDRAGFAVPEVRRRMNVEGSTWMRSVKDPSVVAVKIGKLRAALSADPSLEQLRKDRAKAAVQSIEVRKRASKSQFVAQNRPETRTRRVASMKVAFNTPEIRKNRSEYMKRVWAERRSRKKGQGYGTGAAWRTANEADLHCEGRETNAVYRAESPCCEGDGVVRF